ncbi:oligosaccharide flippase family protein [Flaviflexus equikiangi]|uniref:oligosaccharide flippase family protein n=1 Tax=Flaviflexus equikiangi TaxID=2758573 RepID=UPI0015F587D0|nr:polysaccharide biosynthesis C-terminal domain-containing protein [Flaviflexus equikiangi]
MKNFSLSSNAVVLSAGRAMAQLVMVLVLAVLARIIGAERLGIVASSMALATVASGLIDFGAGSLMIREYSAQRLTASEFASRNAARICYGVISACVMLALGLALGVQGILMLAPAFLLASVFSQTAQVCLVATHKGMKLSVLSFSERMILAVVFGTTVYFTDLTPELAFAAGYLCGSTVMLVLASSIASELKPSFRRIAWRRLWNGSRYYGLSTAVISLQSTDVLIANAVVGPAVAGIYGAVSRWTMPITLATGAFAAIMNPVVSAAKDRDDIWHRIRGALWIPIVSAAIAAIMFIFAGTFVNLVLGEEFASSTGVLQVLALAAALSAFSQVAQVLLQARGRERSVAISLGCTVAVQLVLVPPMVAHFGALGLAVASFVAQTLLSISYCLLLLKVWRRS